MFRTRGILGYVRAGIGIMQKRRKPTLDEAAEKITDIVMEELSKLAPAERKKRIKALEERARRIISEKRAKRRELVRN